MALPTETLPKQAGDLNETPAYFDQANQQAKQLKQDQAKARRQQVEPKATEAELEEDQGGQAAEEYQPFPINPEEEDEEDKQSSEDSEEGNEGEGEGGSEGEEGNENGEVKSEEQQLAEVEQQKQIEAEQARQLADQQQKSWLLKKTAEVSGQGDVANIVSEEGTKELLKWSFETLTKKLSYVSIAGIIYLNAHVICKAQGFSPFGVKLCKPEIKHYLAMIIWDLVLFFVILVVVSIFIILIHWTLDPVGFIYKTIKDAVL